MPPPFDAAAIRAYTSAILRARHEYHMHPFAWFGHGEECAAEGCRDGQRAVERRRKKK